MEGIILTSAGSNQNMADPAFGKRNKKEIKKNKMIERNKEFEDDNGYKTTGRTGNRTDIRIVRPNFVRAEKNDCFC